MKQTLVFLSISLLSIAAFGQIKFEPGYYITNEGQRIDCQIMNVDWQSNPTSFNYRLGDSGESIAATIDQVAEFGILNGSRYKRVRVLIDRSPTQLGRMTYNRSPEFSDETLFLRIVVTGKGTLYEHYSGSIRFFFSVDDSPVQQLIYKGYKAASQDIAYNEMYKQQLLNEFKCEKISKKDAEALTYTRKDLVKYFAKFNECHGSTTAIADAPKERVKIVHLTLRPGLTYNSMKITNVTTQASAEWESKLSYRIGFEIESVLPFNKGVWSILLEPGYQTYSATAKAGPLTVEYPAVEIGVGLRRYFYPKGSGRIYTNISAVYNIPSGGSAITYNTNPVTTLRLSSGVNMVLAAGYTIKKFQLELRYSFNRGVMGDYLYYESTYGGPALVVGYQIF